MNDMKLIIENWRKYSTLIENDEGVGSIYLFENKTRVEKDFKILLEDFDNGKITEDALYECWYKSTMYEHKLLNEGFMDVMRSAGKEVSGAWEKTKDWVLKKSIQVWQLAKRGIQAAIEGAKILIDAAADFKAEHPIAYRVTVVIALGIAMFALISALDSNQAQAAIKAPGLEGGIKPHGQGEIGSNAYEALRGLIHQTKEAGLGGTDLELRATAMRLVDSAQAAGETVDFSTLTTAAGKFANEELKVLDGLYKLAREGDQQALQWIGDLIEVGKSSVYKIQSIPTR